MTFSPSQYELIDFGSDEKLERFGDRTVRRETPSVAGRYANKRKWSSDAFFGQHRDAKQWQNKEGNKLAHDAFEPWSVDHAGKRFLLKLTPSGQVGVFPEQVKNWEWIEQSPQPLNGCRAINLFGYTGGTTMSLAKCGASVTHVDSARPAVEWARANAKASDLQDASIRWIVDDALSFVRREIKRGNQYDIVVADPPSFGRGPKQTVWKIQRDLELLMELAGQLSSAKPKMYIFSCHTPGIDRRDLQALAHKHLDLDRGAGEAIKLSIAGPSNQMLASGDCFRWRTH